ncbi:MAG: hypothetical protein ACRDAX_05990 [Propionibacteriaceae bacterium]
MLKKSVSFCLVTSAIISSTLMSSATPSNAAPPAIETILQSDDRTVEILLSRMASEFEITYNQNPQAFEEMLLKLSQPKSHQPLNKNIANENSVEPLASWESFSNCVGDGLSQAFAIDILKQAINKEVVDALKSRQWRVASSIIHKNLSKLVGSKGASFIIKKIANKALPGGLPGQLAWIAGKCGVKEFI